jgi:hypothetical protein
MISGTSTDLNIFLDVFCIKILNNIAKSGRYSRYTLEEKLPPYHQFHHEERM